MDPSSKSASSFTVWAFGDAHVGTDLKHDRSGLDEPAAWWWQKWVDPMGTHPDASEVDNSRRPYPVDGTWERYAFRAGNILFLLMSDINEPTQKVGRGTLGGNPGGVVSGETFKWWQHMVRANPGAVDLWLGGHTHTHPDDTHGGKSQIETRWGTHFINVASLTRYHPHQTSVPKSRVLTFTPGSRELRVQCYMHTDEFLPQGWYAGAERRLTLSRPFEL